MKKTLIGLMAMVVALTGCSSLGIGEEKIGTYTVTADVEQATNLFEGNRVTVRGIEVGEITDVRPMRDFVRLTLEIQSDIDVPADAQMSVVPITVIADRYAQLHPPYTGGPRLGEGDHLSLARTSIPAELDEVITQLQGLLESVEPPANGGKGPLARLITNLDAALDGHQDDLSGALDRSAAVLQNLATSDAQITGLVRNLDQLFLALANRSSEIGIINHRFRLVARSLLSDQANLEGTLENIAFLSEETSGLVENSGDQLGEAFRRLDRVVTELLTHQDELTEGMRWTNVIAQTLGAVDASGRGLYAYTGRQAKPGTPGAEYNYRIDQRDTIACNRIQAVYDTITVFQSATPDAVIETLDKYLPDEYEDDINWLLKVIVLRCVDQFNDEGESASAEQESAVTPAERALLLRAERVLGRKRLMEFMARWALGESP